MTSMLPLFRRSVVVFYWIALAFCLLLFAGWVVSIALAPAKGSNWWIAGGVGLFALLIAWRLWLNSRALGQAGPLPTVRRMLLVFLPLGLLALVGLAGMGLGIVWTAMGVWMLFDPHHPIMDVADPLQQGWLMIGLGVIAASVGGLATVPLIRRLKYRPPVADAF